MRPVLVAIIVALAAQGCGNGGRRADVSDEEHFLHGSVGAEERTGVPYLIWLVLPRVFPDYLPPAGSYATLGLSWPPGRDLPAGLSRASDRYSTVAVNCAACHQSTPRGDAAALQRYTRFLGTAAADPRFSSAAILGEIAKNYELSTLDRLRYRLFVIPRTRARLRELAGRPLDHSLVTWATDTPAVERSANYIRKTILSLNGPK